MTTQTHSTDKWYSGFEKAKKNGELAVHLVAEKDVKKVLGDDADDILTLSELNGLYLQRRIEIIAEGAIPDTDPGLQFLEAAARGIFDIDIKQHLGYKQQSPATTEQTGPASGPA